MKVLILSCSTGEGHNSAARAVDEELRSCGMESEVRDPVSFKSRHAVKVVSSCYNNIIRVAPDVFGAIYRAGELYDSTGLKSPIYLANSVYAEKLFKYINENRIDAVAATHLYGMEALTAIKKKLGKYVPSYGIMTDYTVTPFQGDVTLDGYFIPHEDLRSRLIEKNIPNDRIFATGIPVSAKFAHHIDMDEARRMLGIPLGKKVLTVMSGGIGGGNVTGLCDELVRLSDEYTSVYVLAGKNDALYQKIQERYSDCGNVTAVPFTREVNVYMNASDVLLSKPGGLSSTEAAVANVPLVHINAIPGCESANVRFFADHGMSVGASNVEEAANVAFELMGNKEKSERMRMMQRLTINPDAAKNIVQKIKR